MATLKRCELWTDYECAAGTRKAFLALDQIAQLQTTERVTREDQGTCLVSKESAAYAEISVGRVLRFLFTDGSVKEWRIQGMLDKSTRAREVTLRLISPLQELGIGAAMLSETTASVVSVDLEWKALSPAQVVTKLLAFCPAYWSAGTITPTIPVNLSPSGWMPLRGFRELINAIRAQGIDAELDWSYNGTSGFFVHIVTAIGASAAALDVRTAKNLLGTERDRNRDRYAAEVIPLGSGSPRATMARGWLEVTAKGGAVCTVQQPVTGGPIIAFDDQWNGLYLIDDTGARQQITDCVAGATQTLTLASAANVTVGRWYRYALNSTGDELIRLRKLESVTGPIQTVESSALDATTNLTTNPAMRVWTGGAGTVADGWTKGVGTYTRTTTAGLWLYGGQSCRIQTAAQAFGLRCPRLALYVPTWATSVQFSVWIYMVTGGANLQIDWDRDGGGASRMGLTSLAGVTTNIWTRYDAAFSTAGLTGAVHDFDVYVNATAVGTYDLYVDAVQIAFASGAVPFVEGSNATRLLAIANRYLTKLGTVPAAYRMAFANLQEWDPVGFAFDAVQLGQTANARDTDLNDTVSARILELNRNWKNPLASELVAANRPDDLVSILTGLTG